MRFIGGAISSLALDLCSLWSPGAICSCLRHLLHFLLYQSKKYNAASGLFARDIANSNIHSYSNERNMPNKYLLFIILMLAINYNGRFFLLFSFHIDTKLCYTFTLFLARITGNIITNKGSLFFLLFCVRKLSFYLLQVSKYFPLSELDFKQSFWISYTYFIQIQAVIS